MSSSSSEKIPKRRFFKQKKHASSTSTPIRKRVLLPSTSISDINTSSSGDIKRQTQKIKPRKKTKSKVKKELKNTRDIPLQKEISAEWETASETLQNFSIRKTISESKIQSPKESSRRTYVIEDRPVSPIFAAELRRRTKRKSREDPIISFGDEEEIVSTRRQKPSLRKERRTSKENSQQFSRRAVFRDAGSLKTTQKSPRLFETDILFTDLRSPRRIQTSESDIILTSPEITREATDFIHHDRLGSPFRRLGTQRSEVSKRISLEEKGLPVSPECLLPQSTESPPLVLRRENAPRTYPGAKHLKRYNMIRYVYRHLQKKSPAYSCYLLDDSKKIKKYLRLANDENRTFKVSSNISDENAKIQTPKTLANDENPFFIVSRTTISDEIAKMHKPKTLAQKFGRNMSSHKGVLDMSTRKWTCTYENTFDEEFKKRMRRTKVQAKEAKVHSIYDFTSSSSPDEYVRKRSKTKIDSDNRQLTSNDKRTLSSVYDNVSLPSTSRNTEKSDQPKFFKLRRLTELLKEREKMDYRKRRSEGTKLKAKKKIPVVVSVKEVNDLKIDIIKKK